MNKPMSEQMQKLSDRYEKATGKKVNVKTNAQKIRSMSDDELSEFLSSITYGRETPWSELFSEKFCKACPVTKVDIPEYLNPLLLHECDFTDGKCHHGSDIVWWLKQPSEEETLNEQGCRY